MAKKPILYPISQPSLCVVICVHNAPDYVAICIESVLKHTSGDYDLVLVNDGSAAQTTNILKAYQRDYPHIRMVHHAQAKGYTKAANAGLHASNADYTILLNSDTIVSPHWAERIIACGESDKTIGIIGPLSNAATYQSVPFVFDDRGHWKQNELQGDVTVASYAEAINRVALKSYPRVPVANGFCFAVKRKTIDAIGYLDEETFPRGYGEENDYCLRAADAGFEIAIADNAYVYHATSKSFGVKSREELTRSAHHAIRSKYSESRLNEIDTALRNHPQMDQVRQRVHDYVHNCLALTTKVNADFSKPNQHMAVLFLLPDCSAKSGGTQVIVETARGLNAIGVHVRIAAKESIRKEYEQFFPADTHLFLYYRKPSELLTAAHAFDVAIATIFHSAAILQDIIKIYPHIMPAYYVQDYEPFFLDAHPKLQQQAVESYTLIAHNNLFALSPWVVQTLKDKHQSQVHKIWGSLDQSLFFPDYAPRNSAKTTISAMVRPDTHWRGPEQTMRVLKKLHDKYGDTIAIRIFGCDNSQLDLYNLDSNFEFSNYGVLGRYDVAACLRSSDIFLDLSTFQAFGRTALEAMACGCAVIAPIEGGVHDFGEHGENILQVDTADESACLNAASELIEDTALRQHLRERAIAKGMEYSIHRSTLSFLQLMYQLKSEHKAKRQNAA